MADFKEKLDELNATEDTTSQFDQADIEANKGISVLAYFGWLLLIPLLTRKESAFVKFHCNQGLTLAILSTVCSLIVGIFGKIAVIGSIISLAVGLVNIGVFILFIMGIVNVVNGRAKELPIIGGIKFLN